jgi:hypothetical protein
LCAAWQASVDGVAVGREFRVIDNAAHESSLQRLAGATTSDY